MSEADKKVLRDLLKHAEGLWAELKAAGYCEADCPEPWQFTNAKKLLKT